MSATMATTMSVSEMRTLLTTIKNKKKLSENTLEVLKNLDTIAREKIGAIAIKIEKYINMFNIVLEDMCKVIGSEVKNDVSVGTYVGITLNVVKTKPIEPISLFIVNVSGNIKYKQCILEKDDRFFMTGKPNDISEELDINTLFQFRDFWKVLNDDCKDYIKNAMVTLVEIGDKYIIAKDDGYKLADIIKEINCIC